MGSDSGIWEKKTKREIGALGQLPEGTFPKTFPGFFWGNDFNFPAGFFRESPGDREEWPEVVPLFLLEETQPGPFPAPWNVSFGIIPSGMKIPLWNISLWNKPLTIFGMNISLWNEYFPLEYFPMEYFP